MHAREPRIKCNDHGKKTVDLPWARKGSGFSLHFEAMVAEMCREMPVSAVSRMVGIDEFSVEKHHVYVTLFYDIRNSRVVDIEEVKIQMFLENS